MVRGENIGQTFAFVSSGNAELGLVANAQVMSPKRPQGGSLWEVPVSLYDPIEQQAVLLRDNVAARAFMAFVTGEEVKAIIRAYGYDTP
jgi:molybdate transport system substrate-binding protein